MMTTLPAPAIDAGVTTTIDEIRDHYDTLSPFYRRFWGEHIHHGYWRGDESAVEAQENLIRELASRAEVSEGDRVLDVGCGLGGSSLLLAREYGVMVKGISLSEKQVSAAREEARRRGLLGRANFEVRDAHDLQYDHAIYDVIWVVECSEHLFNKPSFIRECANHLAPGGRLAICAWLTGENLNADQQRLVEAVRVGMLCPSFGSLADYTHWMLDAGLSIESAEDVTAHVTRTWSLCRPILDFPLVKTMLAAGSEKLAAFAESFTAIDDAYHSKAMGYGMFVASKPR